MVNRREVLKALLAFPVVVALAEVKWPKVVRERIAERGFPVSLGRLNPSLSLEGLGIIAEETAKLITEQREAAALSRFEDDFEMMQGLWG